MLYREFQEIYNNVELMMGEALTNSAHPYRTFSLASVDDKFPNLRTVVLRKFSFEKCFIDCHSDIRSPKVDELQKNDKFSALFYSNKEKIQLRFKGKVEILHKNSFTKERWKEITPSSKRCYLGPYNPSDRLEKYHPNIPENVKFENPSEEESIMGYDNFVIIRCHFNELDYLKLKYSGHLRCKLVFEKKNINAFWLAP